MVEQIIQLEPEDDYHSIRDRLDWVRAKRVLLVLPSSSEPVGERLALVLVQRHASRLQLELGLVCTDPGIVAEARDLGIPVFPTIEIGQNRSWRWPWRPARQPKPPAPPPVPDPGDLRETYRRNRPRPTWQRWVARLGGIVVFVFTLASLLVSAIYLIPGATVVLHPDTQVLTVTSVVVADPAVETADYKAGIVPARIIRVQVAWRGAAATTGNVDVPDAYATGVVLFINQQAAPATIPAGTVVRTTAGTTVRFRTTQAVEMPAVVGATVEAPVVALDPGAWSNVGPNLINQLEGALALQLQVRNLSPTEGGGVRQVKSVTQADMDRLRNQVAQQLLQLGKAEIPNWMTPSEFLAEETLLLYVVQRADYNRYVGEQADSVELEMSALVQGVVVDGNEGFGVAYTQLAAATPQGYHLIPESIGAPRRGEVIQVDDEGRVTFLLQGRARAAANINQVTIAQSISGLPVAQAEAWILREVPVDRAPAIRVWPSQFGRLPYLPTRITTRIDTAG